MNHTARVMLFIILLYSCKQLNMSRLTQYLSLLLLLHSLRPSSSECPPNVYSLPAVLHDPADNSTEYVCAYAYADAGAVEPIRGCNGPRTTLIKDEDHVSATYYGSLAVMPGCTFYGFSQPNYEGSVYSHSGPAVLSYLVDNSSPSYPRGLYNSSKCRCLQAAIDCTPTEAYESVVACDNRSSHAEATCTYSETIGTSYTSGAAESRSVSHEAQASVEASLFSIFSANIGVSSATGRDWTRLNEETFSAEVTAQIELVVPPGQLVSWKLY